MLTTIFSPAGRKALAALVASIVGYGVSVGLLDSGTAQTIVSVAAGLLTVIAVFYTTNEPAP